MSSDGGYKLPMTDEEKRIIEELLADCSPTVQRIINAHNMFTIPHHLIIQKKMRKIAVKKRMRSTD